MREVVVLSMGKRTLLDTLFQSNSPALSLSLLFEERERERENEKGRNVRRGKKRANRTKESNCCRIELPQPVSSVRRRWFCGSNAD
jgi:hypothetical protein